MLTDIFARRYADFQIWTEYGDNESRLLQQCIAIAKEALPYPNSDNKLGEPQRAKWKSLHDRLARELGVAELSPRYTPYKYNWGGAEINSTYTNEWVEMCAMFVTSPYYPLSHRTVDRYMKERLSLIELVMRDRQSEVITANQSLEGEIVQAKLDAQLRLRRIARDGVQRPQDDHEQWRRAANAAMNNKFDELVNELNVRFQQAGVPLRYHNGYIQVARDELVEQNIAKPFWDIVATTELENVALHMNQALDYRDAKAGDAAWYACMALESTIKIVSDRKNWTTGKERGAHNYIENLVADRDGVRFIEIFEMEVLKSYFTNVRNLFGHGPGSKPMPNLTVEQNDWAIEFAMSWIRTLLRRL
ncbi:hypothetical protein WI93_20400 [Burkholderia vietnamiensis]|uniref:AbiJ-NTD4 domain-containing protein n=1 Tax=Burkholderia vietnamiensis TaxID=60552 RepID=UPI00075EAF28|nr:hypothetical protein [Burkholderia vietnamiensis]KVE23115.1 hypothetical protein WI93_20400 [Burkholderia vietnamiensis]